MVHSYFKILVLTVIAACGWCVQDGVLRQFDVSDGDEVRVANSYNIDAPITCLTFSYTYQSIVMGSPMVGIWHVWKIVF